MRDKSPSLPNLRAAPHGGFGTRHVLLVGGGSAAAGEARRLLTGGARLTVVAPELLPAFYDWAYEGAVALKRRRFRSSDVALHDLVLAATGRDSVDRLVADAARRAGVSFAVLGRGTDASSHERTPLRLVTPAAAPEHATGAA